MNLYDKITYHFLIQLRKFLSIISEQSRNLLSNYLASLFFNFIDIRKRQAEINIKKAFPEFTEEEVFVLLKKTYQFFCYHFIEFICAPKSWNNLKLTVEGKDILESNLEQNRGVIFISGHFGAWEILGKWLGQHTKLFAGIALRQKNRGADRFFQEQRELPGTKQFYKRENAIEKAYDVLKNNGVLGLVSDQDAKSKGSFVKFFGHPASTPRGAALFHINTLSPIIVGVCVQEGFKKYKIKLFSVNIKNKDVDSITQSYTEILENCIRDNPEQYFWFHRRWKTIP